MLPAPLRTFSSVLLCQRRGGGGADSGGVRGRTVGKGVGHAAPAAVTATVVVAPLAFALVSPMPRLNGAQVCLHGIHGPFAPRSRSSRRSSCTGGGRGGSFRAPRGAVTTRRNSGTVGRGGGRKSGTRRSKVRGGAHHCSAASSRRSRGRGRSSRHSGGRDGAHESAASRRPRRTAFIAPPVEAHRVVVTARRSCGRIGTTKRQRSGVRDGAHRDSAASSRRSRGR
jgi:hypothetical protein